VLDTIAVTDGIVFIEAGRCGSAPACLSLTLTLAGPNRILRVLVDTQRPDCEVMASIGHELWHAVEVLRERWIRSTGEMYGFITKGGQNPLAGWRRLPRARPDSTWRTSCGIEPRLSARRVAKRRPFRRNRRAVNATASVVLVEQAVKKRQRIPGVVGKREPPSAAIGQRIDHALHSMRETVEPRRELREQDL
jgi:hypothetical protein